MRAHILALLLAATPCAYAADPQNPVVVELFQSQGCSSCPPANANLLAIASRPDVLALTWEVTYWDYLGWTDTFGSKSFTARQWDYARGLGNTEVYTPQMVLNQNSVQVGAAELRGDVFLVRYDPDLVQVPVLRGENGGRTLPHRNVVREFRRLGAFEGAARRFELPMASRPGLKTAILVQAGPGGPILAATHS
jgi:hypothetical protein